MLCGRTHNVKFTLFNHIAYISWSDCQKINHVHVYIVNLCTYKKEMCSEYVRVTIIFDLSEAIYVHICWREQYTAVARVQ